MPGRVIGLDYGLRRIGVAISDPMRLIAQGLLTIKVESFRQAVSSVKAILVKHEAMAVVVGLPLTLRGTEGQAVKVVENFIEALEKEIAIPVLRVDERFTSVIAKQTLVQLGKSPGKKKGEIDKLSASLILQTYLDNPQFMKETS